MARFIAIPVRLGDAFYLERDGRSILVDGGDSITAFPELFRHHINRSGADIVVCTHNDADHANGIIGFLESGLTCREVWLPGRWLDAINDLLRPGSDVVREIVKGAFEYLEREIGRNQEIPHSFEEIGIKIVNNGNSEMRSDRVEVSSEWPNEITADIDDVDRIYNPVDWEPWWKWYIPPPVSRSSVDPIVLEKIISEAIDAGLRICRIAKLAFDNGIPMKWFEHAPQSPAGGIPGFLQPISARQIVRVYPYLPLFARIALTTVNEESLALYSPPDGRSPGVLFCADSDLHDMRIPVTNGDLITVPHHGAEANFYAYNAIANTLGLCLPSLVWVRSDRRTRQRPCSSFIGLPGRKFCTVCRTGPSKQRILMIGRRGVWAQYRNLHLCSC